VRWFIGEGTPFIPPCARFVTCCELLESTAEGHFARLSRGEKNRAPEGARSAESLRGHHGQIVVPAGNETVGAIDSVDARCIRPTSLFNTLLMLVLLGTSGWWRGRCGRCASRGPLPA
jgi:hypothetical protein